MLDALILVRGKVSRLIGDAEDGGAVCQFRIGNMPCRARAALAEEIVGHRGWPGHEVSVTGTLQLEGSRKKVLAIETLKLVD